MNHLPELAALLTEAAPGSLLLIAPDPAQALPAGWAGQHPDCRIVHVPPSAELDPAQLAPADFALVAGALEHLPAARGKALLAALRDRLTRHLALVVPLSAGAEPWAGHASGWDANTLLGLGFSQRGRWPDGAGHHHGLFVYAIETYKTVPDWLNSRFWANPERWKP